uniref:Nucleotide-diphospho-sugar transferase domain-containing protein n=1 Tax=Steinernema glaseri TaxID=37863 RepID=A0A1I8A505_9BILA
MVVMPTSCQPSGYFRLPRESFLKKNFVFLLIAALSLSYVLIYGILRFTGNDELQTNLDFGAQWLENLPPEECKSDTFTICYGYNTDGNSARNLTGAAFPCKNPKFFTGAAPKRQAAFVVAADSELLSQLLVLIGSFHKYYKEHPILVYDIGDQAHQKKHLRGILANIRNVEVIVADDLIPTTDRQTYNSGAYKPFLMIDSLKKYDEVYWMNPLHEIISDQIIEYAADAKSATYLRIGPRAIQEFKQFGFAKYFPFSSLAPKNSSFRYLRNARQTRNILYWLAQCAQTADCWQCKNADGARLDCLPFLETRLSADFDMPLVTDHRRAALEQKWSAPECGWRCALSSLAAIFTFVILTASLLFVISARFVAD